MAVVQLEEGSIQVQVCVKQATVAADHDVATSTLVGADLAAVDCTQQAVMSGCKERASMCCHCRISCPNSTVVNIKLSHSKQKKPGCHCSQQLAWVVAEGLEVGAGCKMRGFEC